MSLRYLRYVLPAFLLLPVSCETKRRDPGPSVASMARAEIALAMEQYHVPGACAVATSRPASAIAVILVRDAIRPS